MLKMIPSPCTREKIHNEALALLRCRVSSDESVPEESFILPEFSTDSITEAQRSPGLRIGSEDRLKRHKRTRDMVQCSEDASKLLMKCRPENYEDFWARLSTFDQPLMLFKNDVPLSPALFSRYGWCCTGINLLHCFVCKKDLQINNTDNSMNFSLTKSMLLSKHDPSCGWTSSQSPERFAYIPDFDAPEKLAEHFAHRWLHILQSLQSFPCKGVSVWQPEGEEDEANQFFSQPLSRLSEDSYHSRATDIPSVLATPEVTSSRKTLPPLQPPVNAFALTTSQRSQPSLATDQSVCNPDELLADIAQEDELDQEGVTPVLTIRWDRLLSSPKLSSLLLHHTTDTSAAEIPASQAIWQHFTSLVARYHHLSCLSFPCTTHARPLLTPLPSTLSSTSTSASTSRQCLLTVLSRCPEQKKEEGEEEEGEGVDAVQRGLLLAGLLALCGWECRSSGGGVPTLCCPLCHHSFTLTALLSSTPSASSPASASSQDIVSQHHSLCPWRTSQSSSSLTGIELLVNSLACPISISGTNDPEGCRCVGVKRDLSEGGDAQEEPVANPPSQPCEPACKRLRSDNSTT